MWILHNELEICFGETRRKIVKQPQKAASSAAAVSLCNWGSFTFRALWKCKCLRIEYPESKVELFYLYMSLIDIAATNKEYTLGKNQLQYAQFQIWIHFRLTLFCLRRNKWGAPPGGCRGTAGSGVTSCTGRGGLSASFLRLAIRLSHIKDTSSMRWSTCNKCNTNDLVPKARH